ncbi:alcohol dehydrogenase catalytic domain-containing protein [Arthrobacter bambusae]|uniref:alcohol dehydrogenase catalytic domain-containing protein n=1 Tax=Arthrobacter bambusae TaxID=1338426 RepID=UPI002782100B|nr:alcohol dehydrogenase catalytic domain-containing protein [Arthrobacter bambusae]MDQ0028484.1 propanol-preferring alcohol dehydrogenase [Arthrobacter bambusae]MDQ0096721.1 propanol-preferring alcohol dehydrogenase [Arthrobacter bambusae]
MKAVVLPGDETVSVQSFEDPVPGAGEVLIRVKATAVCGSDLTALRGEQVVGTRPERLVPGHEVAGIVEAVGPGATSVAVGDRVAVYLAIGCMKCENCRAGNLMLCPEVKILGFDVQGGDAELVVVPAVNCMRLPDEMSFAEGAVATDMFGTQYSAQDRLGVSGADTVVVSGLGPMGAAAVAIAKARGARVIAIDPVEHRRELGLRLGADVVLPAVNDEVRTIGIGRGHGGPDVVIECSGNVRAQAAALEMVRPLGRVAFVGESRELKINPSEHFLRKLTTVIGAWYFPIWQFDEITQFLIERKVPVNEIISHRLTLDDAPKAFEMLAARSAEKMVFEL